MSIKAIVASIPPFVAAVIVNGLVVGWFVGITGEPDVVMAAVLPVVLTGVGVALYIPFRKGSIDASQAGLMGILSTVFATSIFFGYLVSNIGRETVSKEIEAIEARERLSWCTWMEYKINLERGSKGLRPLDYREVCP